MLTIEVEVEDAGTVEVPEVMVVVRRRYEVGFWVQTTAIGRLVPAATDPEAEGAVVGAEA